MSEVRCPYKKLYPPQTEVRVGFIANWIRGRSRGLRAGGALAVLVDEAVDLFELGRAEGRRVISLDARDLARDHHRASPIVVVFRVPEDLDVLSSVPVELHVFGEVAENVHEDKIESTHGVDVLLGLHRTGVHAQGETLETRKSRRTSRREVTSDRTHDTPKDRHSRPSQEVPHGGADTLVLPLEKRVDPLSLIAEAHTLGVDLIEPGLTSSLGRPSVVVDDLTVWGLGQCLNHVVAPIKGCFIAHCQLPLWQSREHRRISQNHFFVKYT